MLATSTKVTGEFGYVVIENDYPFLFNNNSKKRIKSKIKDQGTLQVYNLEDAALVAAIITKLEYIIKNSDTTKNDNVDFLRSKKPY